ncbi:FAD-binding oxidoreductase [Coxiella burnetii]|uniref:FAD-binding oxidoreductase n=1 Tax=Coxiella burnetii TaxID=777 RepID=UPI002231D9D0|nr:FAD-binding oxidoreductase [Coxiella burnetii]
MYFFWKSPQRFIAFVIYASVLITHVISAQAAILDDKGFINPTAMHEVVHVYQLNDILKAIQRAKRLLGKQHSQGGQTLIQGGIALDTLSYNHVLKIDTRKMQVTVQPGITWNQLQVMTNPYQLAIGVMQSSGIFTVGGSLSVNVHGLDFRRSPLVNTIVAFHLVLANGKIVKVSPRENAELWRATIGGYGLLGVISDVTLQLVPDNILKSKVQSIDIPNLSQKFKDDILPHKENALFLGRLSIAPDKTFLNNVLLLTFSNTHAKYEKQKKLINPESMDFFIKPLFNLARYSNKGKYELWKFERIGFNEKYHNKNYTRNNAMRLPIEFAVQHHQKNHADWLQEYYIPVDRIAVFMNFLREIMIKNKVNLLNATIRYVQKDSKTILNYANQPCFSIVLYFDQNLGENEIYQTRHWTRQLIDKAQELNGNYYLPYQAFATRNQFRTGYPGYKKFLEIKRKYDPAELFSSEFYKRYF